MITVCCYLAKTRSRRNGKYLKEEKTLLEGKLLHWRKEACGTCFATREDDYVT